MPTGKLTQVVEIQNPSDAAAAGTRGQRTATFATVESVKASVLQLTAREREFARQIDPVVTHTVEMHYTSNLTERSRLKWGTRTLNVESIENVENRNRWLIIGCQELK